MYRPQPNVYLRLGVHDANADAEEWGFDSLFDEGQLFKIFEVGFDPGLMERLPGRPPFGDVHISLWQQDQRDDDRVAEAWGFTVSGSQRFGRFLPFLRYGYADSDSSRDTSDPTPIEHMINGGLAIDNIFGQRNDRIGIGLTWSRPLDNALDDQGALDLYYRIQVTPQIALSPTLHLVIDPVRNPNEDEIAVLGLRTRFVF
jgi:porin